MKDVFTRDGIDTYARTRYNKADQRFVHRREQNILRRYLSRTGRSSQVILDVPCGYGRFSELLLDFSSRVLGSDLSLSMVQTMLDRSPGSRSKLWGVVGNAVSGLPFRASSVSGIVSVRLFQHLHTRAEREALLREFARLARDFVVLSYYRWNVLHAAHRRFRRKFKSTQTTICMVSRAEFLESIRKAGLEVMHESAVLPGLHAHHFVLLRVKNGRKNPSAGQNLKN